MERKRALAVAAAATVTLGCTIVAGASIGGYSLLGFGGTSDHGPGSFSTNLAVAHRKSVTKYRDVYDAIVVDTAPSRASGNADPAPAVDPALPALSPSNADANAPSDAPSGGTPSGSDDSNDPESPTTVAPAPEPPTTVNPAPTPTTVHVEIPDDWPPGTPLPPMPPNCREPHLEDNGVWNCQGDD